MKKLRRKGKFNIGKTIKKDQKKSIREQHLVIGKLIQLNQEDLIIKEKVNIVS